MYLQIIKLSYLHGYNHDKWFYHCSDTSNIAEKKGNFCFYFPITKSALFSYLAMNFFIKAHVQCQLNYIYSNIVYSIKRDKIILII